MEPISTTSIITTLLATFKDPLLKKFNNLTSEIDHIFNNSLNNYVTNYYNKYSKPKTFIYRDEKVDFYEVFYPVTIKNSSVSSRDIDDLKKIIFQEKFITIIGSAGSGKSMLMKHIFLSCIHQFYTIPIVVELRNLNDLDITILDYISSVLTKNKLAKSDKILEKILQEGNFVFLLDGYDEIFSDNKNKITNEIEELVDLYSNNAFIITSRPGANAESFQRFNNYFVQPLNSKQVNEFVNIQFKNHENKESIGKIISVIEKRENRDYLDYFTNPLLLSMFIFTFSSHPEIPKKKSKFYWNVFDTLCTKHDTFTKKGFWLHERKSKLKNEELELILKWFSYISLFKGKYNFDVEYLRQTLASIVEKFKLNCEVDHLIYDFSVSISILIQDGIEFSFPHKSLQEYFVSMLIQSLNDEQKKVIYTEKFKLLTKKTTGGNQNFFKLCEEVDRPAFLKYFLIPLGEEYINLNKEIINKNDRLKNFFKYFEMRIILRKNDSNLGFAGTGYRVRPIHTFLEFFNKSNVFGDFDYTNFSCLSLLEKVKLEYIRDGDFDDEDFDNEDFDNEDFDENQELEIFLHRNFENANAYISCSKLINAEDNLSKIIVEKIAELNSQIKEESLSTSQLLNL